MTGAPLHDYTSFFRTATGQDPYPWQERVAAGPLPEVVEVPTGAGKTAGLALGWLWRRQQPDTRPVTPRRLLWALPMRVLASQTFGAVNDWVRRLGLPVEVTLLVGGESRDRLALPPDPSSDAVVIGTIDMLLSRALNRGYAAGPFAWPVDFGLVNNDSHWVLDEVQLLGPAVATSRQLQAFRDGFGTVGPTGTTWMSATLALDALDTVDNPVTGAQVLRLDDRDRAGALATRLGGAKRVDEVRDLPERRREQELAAALLAAHQPGTLTLAVCNTVTAARSLWKALKKDRPAPELVLVHARFRPPERDQHTRVLLEPVDPAGPGRIAVCTQVVEAGVDLSAATMFTEAAPWPSIVQRAGRCNRDGTRPDARLLWAPPARPEPYPKPDVAASVAALRDLEGTYVTPESLAAQRVPVTQDVHHVLRRRDLIELFDTTPDLTGNLLDVARFVRVAEDVDAYVCWRPAATSPGLTATDLEAQPPPAPAELCPVPARDLSAWARRTDRVRLWWRDHAREAWVPVDPSEVRPGRIYVVDAAAGGYDPTTGWDPTARSAVGPVPTPQDAAPDARDDTVGADPSSLQRRCWVRLERHLVDVAAEADRVLEALGPVVPARIAGAVRTAAALHDAGKAHPVFQATMAAAAGEALATAVTQNGPWAKSPGSARHERRGFRHELAGALQLRDALASDALGLPPGVDAALVVYLVAAHHGRVRLGARALPHEVARDGERQVLGVRDGDVMPAVATPAGTVPSCTLRLDGTEIGRSGDRPSWSELALGLRDDPELGPFRMALAEALVVLSDRRASAAEEAGPDDLAEVRRTLADAGEVRP